MYSNSFSYLLDFNCLHGVFSCVEISNFNLYSNLFKSSLLQFILFMSCRRNSSLPQSYNTYAFIFSSKSFQFPSIPFHKLIKALLSGSPWPPCGWGSGQFSILSAHISSLWHRWPLLIPEFCRPLASRVALSVSCSASRASLSLSPLGDLS